MDKKKLSAISAAVFTYIKTQEEAAAFQAQAGATPPDQGSATTIIQQVTGQSNIWGMSGRQSQMQANTMMLMRAFK